MHKVDKAIIVVSMVCFVAGSAMVWVALGTARAKADACYAMQYELLVERDIARATADALRALVEYGCCVEDGK